jgi:ribosome-associated translation inhibitor RaiA
MSSPAIGLRALAHTPSGESMKLPLQLRLIDVASDEGLETAVRAKAAKLEQFVELTSCHVTIEQLDRHKRQGRQYAVRIEATLPGLVLNVGHVHDEDVHVALRDAFDDMRRQIQDSTGRAQEHDGVPEAGPAGNE